LIKAIKPIKPIQPIHAGGGGMNWGIIDNPYCN
jgi:CRISPR/Cas system CMR subunit Cmr4 (Cas7 group RAMP superfamily)